MGHRISLVLMYGLITIGFFQLISEDGIQAYFLLRNELLETKQSLEAVSKKELALSGEIRLLRSNSDYIIEQVKTKIHYVYPNEILYTFYRQGADN